MTNIQDLFEKWSVLEPGMYETQHGPAGWWAVANDNGIIAYFGDEKTAYRFRLAEINRELNG